MISSRLATKDDVIELYKLMVQYKNESHSQNREHDVKNTMLVIMSWITNDNQCVLIEQDGIIKAFAAIWMGYTFYKDKELDIEVFYVHPSARKTPVSRMLAKQICKIAEDNNCPIIYTAGLSGGSKQNEKLYQNMWKKLGFRELGTVMIRS